MLKIEEQIKNNASLTRKKKLWTNEKEFQTNKKLKFCTESKRWNISNFTICKHNYNDSKNIECGYELKKKQLLAVVQIEKKNRFYDFAILRCLQKQEKKRSLKLTEHSELNRFTNMVAEIYFNDFKI